MTDDDDSEEAALPLAPLFCATSVDVFAGSRGVEFVLWRILLVSSASSTVVAALLLVRGADVGIIVLFSSPAVLLMLISSVVKSYKYTKKNIMQKIADDKTKR